MIQRQSNKYSRTKQVVSAKQVATSGSHNRRDEHGNDRNSRSMSRNHNYLDPCTRRAHESTGLGSIPSVSPIRRQRRRLEVDILQGELWKIKPPNFNGEHRKGE
jgi:hypothetical protein